MVLVVNEIQKVTQKATLLPTENASSKFCRLQDKLVEMLRILLL